LLCACPLVSRTRCSLGDAKHRPAAMRRRAGARGTDTPTPLEHSLAVGTLLLFRALPDHAGISLQRRQRFAGVGPFLQFLDRNMIERLPPGAARKQRAGNVDHVGRARPLINNRRAAARAETSCGFGRLVLITREAGLALGDTKAFPPASDI